MRKMNKRILLIILSMLCFISVFGFNIVKGATTVTFSNAESELDNSNYKERHTAIIGNEPVSGLISALKDCATTETFTCDDNHFYVLANLLLQKKPVDDKFKVGSTVSCSSVKTAKGSTVYDSNYILGAKRGT